MQAIDFGRSQIWVTQNAVEVGGEIFERTPKSHKIRDVPMPPFLRDELARTVEKLIETVPRRSFSPPPASIIRGLSNAP